MTRNELRNLAEARLKDAKALTKAGRFDAAAYVCGYVLELGLKACICKRLRMAEYPGQKVLRGAFWTHNLEELLLLAGLTDEIDAHGDAALFTNWNVVRHWEPAWRYDQPGKRSKQAVERMLQALEDRNNGILRWLKKRW
jgi:HEPN domain-containing protein